MKKTLIALAAVAVAGAASAQVNLSGYIALGYKTTSEAGVHASGFGTDDAVLSVSTSEDLGGGMKLSASMAIEALEKGGAGSGAGSTLAVEGSFGKLTMSSVEGSDYLPVDGLTTVGNGSVGDRVTFALPSMNGVALSYTYKDGSSTAADGYGFGASKNTKASHSVTAAYATGPLSLSGTYLWTNKGNTTADNNVYIKAGYDFGVAKVTAGLIQSDVPNSNADITETGLTVAMPVGPLAVTAAYASQEVTGSAARSGFSLGASYALSKRTALAFYTESYDSATAGAKNTSESKLELQHSF